MLSGRYRYAERFLTVAFAATVVLGAMLGMVVPHKAVADDADYTPPPPRILNFSHVVSEKDPKGLMANKLRELVETHMGDKLKINVFPQATFTNDENVLYRLLLGDVHFAAPSLSLFGNYTNRLMVFELPFLFKDAAAVERFQNSPTGQSLLGSMKRKGLLGLGYMHHGMKHFSATDPLQDPSNAKGLRIRIQRSDVLVAQMESLGAIPEITPFKVVPRLIQSGVVEGQENTLSNMLSQNIHQLQPYITATAHATNDYMLVVSVGFWTSLSKSVREELADLVRQALVYGAEQAKLRAGEARKVMKNSDTTQFLELTEEQRQVWVEKSRPVWAHFEPLIGADIIDAARAANNQP